MLNFNLEQENALEKIVGFLKRSQSSEKLFLLEGSAGTGKTSLITEIINRVKKYKTKPKFHLKKLINAFPP